MSRRPSPMSESGIAPIPFHPAQVLQWRNGFVAIGVDGEFLSLNPKLEPIGEVKKPFPSPVRHAVTVNDRLIVSWIEHELLVGRLSALELGTEFQNGPERAEIRLSNTIRNAPHPAGAVWSHTLDSEPLAMSGSNDLFSLILWKKGVYAITNDDDELWRMPEPNWSNLDHLPRAGDVVGSSINDGILSVWSRGGGYILYNTNDGNIIKTGVVEYEGILDQVFSDKNSHLLCYIDGTVIWYDNGDIVKQADLSGPVQHAEWTSHLEGWCISGWREECLLTMTQCQRTRLSEIPVQRVPHQWGSLLLLNSGEFIKSSFQ